MVGPLNLASYRALKRVLPGRTTWFFGRSLSESKKPNQHPAPAANRTPAKDVAPCQISLKEPFPNVPPAVHIRPVADGLPTQTMVTTLSNGLKVASEPRFGQFCTVGVVVDSGSRYEVAYPSGVCHFLEKISFCGTQKFPSKDDILQSLEKFGGICDCQSTRDTFLYAASIDRRGLDKVVEILGEAVLRPLVTEEEIALARQAIKFEIEEAERNPVQESFTVEAIHAAAFRQNTLGLAKVCPQQNVDSLSRQTIWHYLSNYHSPERMVLAGVGVDHEELVRYAEKYFVNEKSAWHDDSKKASTVDKSIAQYTGGLITREKDLSNASLGPTPFPELVHLVIGLESVSHQHEDFVACCVLNMLMGGGGSFSAGGPGKGMYTRLYTHVLNHYHWMYSATAFNHAYADAGVFCFSASAPPEMLEELTQVLINEFYKLTVAKGIQSEELERAKKQLQSMLLMNLESRPVIFEDLARQVLAQGHRDPPEHYIDKINAVSADDLKRIAEKMLATTPSVAATGTLSKLPSFKDIELGLLDKKGRMPGSAKKFHLFR